MRLFYLLILLLAGCQHSELFSQKSDPFLAFRGHRELSRWINYREHLRMASPKDITQEHKLVLQDLKESSTVEGQMRLCLILLSVNYPGADIQEARNLLGQLYQHPNVSKDTKAIMVLLSDVSKDLMTMDQKIRNTKNRLGKAIEEKDGLESKIQALTKIEQSLLKKTESDKPFHEVKR